MSQGTKRDLQVQAILFSFIVMGLTAIMMLSGDRTKPALADHLGYDLIDTSCCDDVCEVMFIELSATSYCEAWDGIAGYLVYDANGSLGEGWYGQVAVDPTYEVYGCAACQIDFVLKCESGGTWVLYWSCDCGGSGCDEAWYNLLSENYDCSVLSGGIGNPFGSGTCACGYNFGIAVEIETVSWWCSRH